MVEEGGLEAAQISIESDQNILLELITRYRRYHSELKLGLTVYGAPALFTARLDPDHFQYNKTLSSPKNEEFIVLKKDNITVRMTHSLYPAIHLFGSRYPTARNCEIISLQ